MNHKLSGTVYEQAFMLACLKRGLHPHPSVGDYLPHDIIVQNSAGRLFRVQIKGTQSIAYRGKGKIGKLGRYGIKAVRGGSKSSIDCQWVDVLSVYVEKLDCFYNIPCTDLSSASVWVTPHIKNGKGKYEKYAESWDVYK